MTSELITRFTGSTVELKNDVKLDDDIINALENNANIKRLVLNVSVPKEVKLYRLPPNLEYLDIENIQLYHCIHYDGEQTLQCLNIGEINLSKVYMLQRLQSHTVRVTVLPHVIEAFIHFLTTHRELKYVEISTSVYLAATRCLLDLPCQMKFIFKQKDYYHLGWFCYLKWKNNFKHIDYCFI